VEAIDSKAAVRMLNETLATVRRQGHGDAADALKEKYFECSFFCFGVLGDADCSAVHGFFCLT
jgi:hypothetical protein